MSEPLHPSLNKPVKPEPTVKEFISTLKSQSEHIRETLALFETDFERFDALAILSRMETMLREFTVRYDAVLAKAEANLDSERETLELLKKAKL